MSKDLKDKAISIKGKQYVLVSDRVKYFNETYKDGSIQTELVSDWSSPYIVVKATVIPDYQKLHQIYTGYSQANIGDGMVNKTAALENAETSAVGRALGMMGIGVLDSIASADELHKTTHGETKTSKGPTAKQIDWLRETAMEVNDQLLPLPADGDYSQVDKFIHEQLTISINQVPIWKVKDAVDKLKEFGRTKVPSDEEIEEKLDELVEQNVGIVNLNDHPY